MHTYFFMPPMVLQRNLCLFCVILLAHVFFEMITGVVAILRFVKRVIID